MEELYQLIEEKIKAVGFPGHIDGKAFYQDISAEADEQEEGAYLFMIKKDELLSYQGAMDIMEEQFDLHYVNIIFGDKTYRVDFDA